MHSTAFPGYVTSQAPSIPKGNLLTESHTEEEARMENSYITNRNTLPEGVSGTGEGNCRGKGVS